MIIYPRIHGEHNPARLFKAVDNGSSPYARGTLFWRDDSKVFVRFIPVYTGNIWSVHFLVCREPVHPRIHGEHAVIATLAQLAVGSSPYTRGTRL